MCRSPGDKYCSDGDKICHVFCPNLFFTLNDQILGFQGHPEFTTELMSEIIAEDKQFVEPHVYQAALQSLNEGEPDNRLLAHWIVNFLQQQSGTLEI